MKQLDLQYASGIVITMVLAAYDPLWMFIIPSIIIAHKSWVQMGVKEAQRHLEKKIDALTAILEAKERSKKKDHLAIAWDSAKADDATPTPPPGITVPDEEGPVVLQFPQRNGRAHEVLGVPEDANTILIKRAFRHWIQQYHPDKPHAGSDVEMARKLTEARTELLRRRLIRRYRKAA